MRTLLLYLVFLLFAYPLFGQQTEGENTAKLITRFPFTTLTGGVILIKAKLDTLNQPMNFILDTGSGGISLDSNTVVEFKIPNTPSGKTIHGIAGVREVNFARNHSLVLPGLEVKNLDFYINDYEILSSVYGLKIDGIIGYSFLRQFIVKVNFDSLEIEVFTPGNMKYPRGGTTLFPTFTTLPIQPLTIQDQIKIKTNFYIDTGAGLCFLVTQRLAEDSGFFKKKRKPVSLLAQGLGGKKEIELTISKKIRIGPYQFRKVPTHILDDTHNVISYPFLGGLIGNDLLRRFNLIINYPQKQFHIKPNSHYKDVFDYSYSGMNLYLLDGVIGIFDIVPGSPADLAGVQDGDILFSINNNISNNIQTYKNLLSIANSRVTLIILRDGELRTIKLKIGRIY